MSPELNVLNAWVIFIIFGSFYVIEIIFCIFGPKTKNTKQGFNIIMYASQSLLSVCLLLILFKTTTNAEKAVTTMIVSLQIVKSIRDCIWEIIDYDKNRGNESFDLRRKISNITRKLGRNFKQ